MFRSTIIISITTMFLLWGCRKQEGETTAGDFGYDYYPAVEGNYVEYEVDGFTYDDFFVPVKIDTLHYRVREVMDSAFVDNELRPSLRISRYRKDHDTLSWVLTDVWYATKTDQRVEVVEENQRIVKMVFPLRLYKTWDGNAFNTAEQTDYQVRQLDQPETVNNVELNAVMEVVKEDANNLIETKYGAEKYARGVGLVYRKEVDLRTEVSGAIISGSDITIKITGYGSL